MGMHFGDGPFSGWCDYFHFPEDWIFEHYQGIIFPKDRSGSNALNDELIGLKQLTLKAKHC
jgi:hypothetical protein